jgi:hypothetical protein
MWPEKILDRLAIDTLYKTVRAMKGLRAKRKTSMLMSRTHRENLMRWQRHAATYVVVCSAFILGGKLGQQTSINSRNIRQ